MHVVENDHVVSCFMQIKTELKLTLHGEKETGVCRKFCDGVSCT
jgi:hypothetical protein